MSSYRRVDCTSSLFISIAIVALCFIFWYFSFRASGWHISATNPRAYFLSLLFTTIPLRCNHFFRIFLGWNVRWLHFVGVVIYWFLRYACPGWCLWWYDDCRSFLWICGIRLNPLRDDPLIFWVTRWWR